MSSRWIVWTAAVATIALCFGFAFLDGYNVALAAAS